MGVWLPLPSSTVGAENDDIARTSVSYGLVLFRFGLVGLLRWLVSWYLWFP